MQTKFLLAVCATLALSLAVAGQAPDPAMEMAMKNMEKVMVNMEMAERPQYMMKVQQEAVAHGRAVFNDTGLSTNRRSCNTCHPGGTTTNGEIELSMTLSNGMRPKLSVPTLVGAAATFPKYKVPNDAVIQLAEMNNNCIRMFMMGQPLDLDSRDARDLVTYISTLSNGHEVAVGKM